MSSSSSYIPRPRAHANPPSSARRRNGDQQQLQQRPRSAAYDSSTPSGPSLLQPQSGPTMASSSADNSTYNYSSRRPIAELPMARSRQNFDHSHHQYQYTTPPPPSMLVPSAVPAAASHHHPQFRSKMVCTLSCRHCTNVVCSRGMKAILLGDLRVELYSTDSPPAKVSLVEHDYMTRNCRCRIRDVACLGCGNVIGYHVTQPCATCLESCNNGHFWMFLSDGVTSTARMDLSGTKHLVWAQLPTVELDAMGGMCREGVYELLCR